ncbi:MAG TPA: hypothetical protein PL066_01110 [bacterium]|nr:hypothetical protein [bacterium]
MDTVQRPYERDYLKRLVLCRPLVREEHNFVVSLSGFGDSQNPSSLFESTVLAL